MSDKSVMDNTDTLHYAAEGRTSQIQLLLGHGVQSMNFNNLIETGLPHFSSCQSSENHGYCIIIRFMNKFNFRQQVITGKRWRSLLSSNALVGGSEFRAPLSEEVMGSDDRLVGERVMHRLEETSWATSVDCGRRTSVNKRMTIVMLSVGWRGT